MTSQGDPHRTLGVLPGASLNEIRSAYRRLAKQYHPDAAGERALPRFLAIQAAYERLVDGDGRLRLPGAASGRADGASPGPRPDGDPGARADASRARASRNAWRARRSGSGGAGGAGAGTAPGADAGTATDAGGATPGSRSGGSGERRHRRGPRKATPGSTTYDEAAETPLEPAWDGGAWYGTTMGTYWTINPREYADPRKHGPEYLARARRAAAAGAAPNPVAGTPATGTQRDTDDAGDDS
jgi:curved DNA-binding protein CbpA